MFTVRLHNRSNDEIAQGDLYFTDKSNAMVAAREYATARREIAAGVYGPDMEFIIGFASDRGTVKSYFN